MLPQIAQGNANKVWVIPSEFSQALGNVAQHFGVGDGAPKPPKPRPRQGPDEVDARAKADAEEAARAAREANAQAESATQPSHHGAQLPPAPPEPAA
jgi:hypothetical protein